MIPTLSDASLGRKGKGKIWKLQIKNMERDKNNEREVQKFYCNIKVKHSSKVLVGRYFRGSFRPLHAHTEGPKEQSPVGKWPRSVQADARPAAMQVCTAARGTAGGSGQLNSCYFTGGGGASSSEVPVILLIRDVRGLWIDTFIATGKHRSGRWFPV